MGHRARASSSVVTPSTTGMTDGMSAGRVPRAGMSSKVSVPPTTDIHSAMSTRDPQRTGHWWHAPVLLPHSA